MSIPSRPRRSIAILPTRRLTLSLAPDPSERMTVAVRYLAGGEWLLLDSISTRTDPLNLALRLPPNSGVHLSVHGTGTLALAYHLNRSHFRVDDGFLSRIDEQPIAA